MEIKKSYFAVIPANVRYDRDLSPNAKLLYGEITALCNEKGYCWATNKYFSELYGVAKETVSRWISSLEKKGYVTVEIVYEENSKKIKQRRIHLGGGIDKKINRYRQKDQGPVDKKIKTPIDEKIKENNTVINNTSNTTSYIDDDVFNFYQQNFGTISPYLKDYLVSLIKDYGDELTIEAMKIAVENKARSIKYVNAVLRNWAASGIKTADDIKAAEKERERKKDMSGGNGFRKVKNISCAVDIDKLKEKFKEVLE